MAIYKLNYYQYEQEERLQKTKTMSRYIGHESIGSEHISKRDSSMSVLEIM